MPQSSNSQTIVKRPRIMLKIRNPARSALVGVPQDSNVPSTSAVATPPVAIGIALPTHLSSDYVYDSLPTKKRDSLDRERGSRSRRTSPASSTANRENQESDLLASSTDRVPRTRTASARSLKTRSRQTSARAVDNIMVAREPDAAPNAAS